MLLARFITVASLLNLRLSREDHKKLLSLSNKYNLYEMLADPLVSTEF